MWAQIALINKYPTWFIFPLFVKQFKNVLSRLPINPLRGTQKPWGIFLNVQKTGVAMGMNEAEGSDWTNIVFKPEHSTTIALHYRHLVEWQSAWGKYSFISLDRTSLCPPQSLTWASHLTPLWPSTTTLNSCANIYFSTSKHCKTQSSPCLMWKIFFTALSPQGWTAMLSTSGFQTRASRSLNTFIQNNTTRILIRIRYHPYLNELITPLDPTRCFRSSNGLVLHTSRTKLCSMGGRTISSGMPHL